MAQHLPSTMNALIKETPGIGFVLKSVPLPVPGDTDLLLRIIYSSLCGSDINLYKWNSLAQQVARIPFITGHEAVGLVIAKGKDADHKFTIGSRVAVENHFYCGDCFQCKRNEFHICQNMRQYGHGRGTEQGGCSEYSIVADRYAYKLEYDLSDEQACLLEPTGVAHQALEAVQPCGEITMVIGCGPIGLLACSFAKLFGANLVIATDIQEDRLDRAKVMGADYALNSDSKDFTTSISNITEGNGVGVVVEASGVSAMLTRAFDLLRRGGKIAVIGLPKSDIIISEPITNFLMKGLTVKSIYGRKIFHSWKESEKAVSEKKVKPELLVTHKIPLTRYQEAYELLCSGKAMKILLDPSK